MPPGAGGGVGAPQVTDSATCAVAAGTTVTASGLSPSTEQLAARPASPTVWSPAGTPAIVSVAPTPIGCAPAPSSCTWYPSGSAGPPVEVVATSIVPDVAAQATSKRTAAASPRS